MHMHGHAPAPRPRPPLPPTPRSPPPAKPFPPPCGSLRPTQPQPRERLRAQGRARPPPPDRARAWCPTFRAPRRLRLGCLFRLRPQPQFQFHISPRASRHRSSSATTPRSTTQSRGTRMDWVRADAAGKGTGKRTVLVPVVMVMSTWQTSTSRPTTPPTRRSCGRQRRVRGWAWVTVSA
ncbi:hypothetical protein DFH08DRAFT_901979 [Mycena albidolilacea]|uniref:Uncharacterized protein n=1 Tax=Mycena albidolilacea TaxID=1033008 RepID=A0AAD6Z561_9AGAR|nr:hypothetical protein DFH08DRAFT_901979 [Mycena albidolilacea]